MTALAPSAARLCAGAAAEGSAGSGGDRESACPPQHVRQRGGLPPWIPASDDDWQEVVTPAMTGAVRAN